METTTRLIRLLRSRKGAVSVLFAAAAVPILMLVGLVFSYAVATQARQQLDLAADTAAMAAVNTAAAAYSKGDSNWQQEGVNAGTAWFQNQSAQVLDVSAATVQVPHPITQTVDVQQVAGTGTFNSTVSYTANVFKVAAGMLGSSKIFTVSNTSKAQITTNIFVGVDFLLDNSSSMMIGATENDIQRLGALLYQVPGLNLPASANGLQNFHCAFACHWSSSTSPTADYYNLARAQSPKITLRWDVLQSAMGTAINYMKNSEVVPDQYTIGVYSFGDPATYPLKSIYADGSTDLLGALAPVAANTSPVVIDAANTDFPAAMAKLASIATDAGDGSTAAKPKKALIIVTDGMTDWGNRTIPSGLPGGAEGPMDPANCTAIKQKGYTVYVLYTTYSTDYPLVLLYNQGLAQYINSPTQPGMVPNLQACASSPGDFIQANSPAAITAGLQQLLAVAIGSAGRFTN